MTVLDSAHPEDSKTAPELIKVKDDRPISKNCLILDFVVDLDECRQMLVKFNFQ